MKTRHEEYFTKLLSGLQDILSNPENENYIDLSEENTDATDFMYALGVMLPTYVYNNLTGEKHNMLDQNQMLNSLIVQYNEIKF